MTHFSMDLCSRALTTLLNRMTNFDFLRLSLPLMSTEEVVVVCAHFRNLRKFGPNPNFYRIAFMYRHSVWAKALTKSLLLIAACDSSFVSSNEGCIVQVINADCWYEMNLYKILARHHW